MGLNLFGLIAKYLLFFINFILFIGGLTVLILSIIAITTNMNIRGILGTNLYTGAAYVLIAVSILVILISFLGCFGAFREIRSMLIIYIVLIFVIFLVLMIGAIIGYVFNNRVKDTMRQKMVDSAQNNYGINQASTNIWDAIQQELQCCGVDSQTVPPGYAFWQNTLWYRSKSQAEKVNRIPLSCCDSNIDNNKKTLCMNLEGIGMDYFYSEGCYPKLVTVFQSKSLIFSGLAIALSILSLISIIMALIVIQQIDT